MIHIIFIHLGVSILYTKIHSTVVVIVDKYIRVSISKWIIYKIHLVVVVIVTSNSKWIIYKIYSTVVIIVDKYITKNT
jgi:hypothetical protein